jgi:AcrR family transcriptional regulator
MARRRGEAHGDTLRVALLDAAGALLHTDGPQALTTRRLADTVGTSTQAIYTLFGGKEGILRAMYREGFDRLEECLADVPTAAAPPDYLLGLGRAYRAAALKSPHYYDVMFGRPVPEFEATADDVERSVATQRVLTGGIVRCIESGMLRADADPTEISAFLWAVAHGLVSLELTGHLEIGGAGGSNGDSPVYDRYLMASVAAWLAPHPG